MINSKFVFGSKMLRSRLVLLMGIWLLVIGSANGFSAPVSKASIGTNASATELRLPLEVGEKWWGGVVVFAPQMPFGEKSFAHDLLGGNKGNQTVPLLVSQRGRYVWSEDPFRFEFTNNALVVASSFSQIHEVKAGATLREAYMHASRIFFPPSGKLPDELMFKSPQYNTWIELQYNQNEADILKYAQDIIDNGFPPGVLMIDDNWQEDYGTWEFSTRRFNNPKAMMQKLHSMGFKVMLWIVPFVSADSAEYRSLARAQLLIQEKEQDRPAVVRWWNGASAALDFSNPDAVNWFRRKLDYLMSAYGVDGFKFDAGDDSFYAGGIRSHLNLHPNAHSEAFARIGLDFPLNEYRACWKLGGQPLAQRLRDKDHTWEHLRELIPGIVAQGLMGYAFTCPDMIGGGEISSFEDNKTLDPELIVRAAQCHALMPMMQFSVAPWRVLGAKHLAICREMALLHQKMGAEILAFANDSAKTGEPIIRHMEYQFPGNGWEEIDDQFMLGNSILVAPVLQKGATRRHIQFPEGNWKGEDGAVVTGPQRIEVNAPLSRLPWYRRIE